MTKRTIAALVRLSEDERSMVEVLAKQLGLSMSDVFRQAIRALYKEKVAADIKLVG